MKIYIWSIRIGVCPIVVGCMQSFINTVKECNLKDLGIEDTKFTWANKKAEPQTIYEHLDHGLANEAWSNI